MRVPLRAAVLESARRFEQEWVAPALGIGMEAAGMRGQQEEQGAQKPPIP